MISYKYTMIGLLFYTFVQKKQHHIVVYVALRSCMAHYAISGWSLRYYVIEMHENLLFIYNICVLLYKMSIIMRDFPYTDGFFCCILSMHFV